MAIKSYTANPVTHRKTHITSRPLLVVQRSASQWLEVDNIGITTYTVKAISKQTVSFVFLIKSQDPGSECRSNKYKHQKHAV